MSYIKDTDDLIVLSELGLSYSAKKLLYKNFTETSPNFEGNENYLIKTLSDGVYNKVRARFSSADEREEILKNLERKGIKCIPFFSKDYPEKLKVIKDFPPLLYCKGDISLLHTKSFAIVGSRRTNPKALAECKNISRALSEEFTIVSGAADGADTAALEGAMESGKTVSVLAFGFDNIYPASSARLLSDAEKSGLLLTEYPPSTEPKPYYFPARNRIIAALSEGVLVTSAAKKSGALITAEYAREYGRKLFAFPYDLGTESGEGCNCLIKRGAHLTECAEDIFGLFGIDKESKKAELTDDEREVFDAIRAAGEILLSELADKLKKPVFKVLPVVSSLEMKNVVVRLGGNRYSVL